MPFRPRGQDRRARLDALHALHPSSGRGGYDAEWRALAKAAVALQPWCSRCGATEDLTADHIDPEKRTGLTLDDVQVLCRRHNSKKSG